MTTLREAAQQALEALEVATNCLDGYYIPRGKTTLPEIEDAITALKAALAEPAQEPVAWRWGYRSVTTGEMDWRGYVEIAAHPNLRSPEIIMQPLYTAPPQRKPLTEEEIYKAYEIALGKKLPNMGASRAELIAITRAVERAHGIGGQP